MLGVITSKRLQPKRGDADSVSLKLDTELVTRAQVLSDAWHDFGNFDFAVSDVGVHQKPQNRFAVQYLIDQKQV